MRWNARSVLYVPAHRPRMLAKLDTTPADLFVVDLEDGVAPGEKEAARTHLRDAAEQGLLPADRWALRVNSPASAWFEQDVRLVAEAAPPAIVLPKAEDPEFVAGFAPDQAANGRSTVLMIETAAGVGRARELATASPTVAALLYGSADLRLSLGARPDDARAWECHAMSEERARWAAPCSAELVDRNTRAFSG